MFSLRDWGFSFTALQVNYFHEIQLCGLVTFLMYDFSPLLKYKEFGKSDLAYHNTSVWKSEQCRHRKAENWGGKKKIILYTALKGKEISSRHSNCWRMKTILLNRKSIATFVHKLTYITSCHWTLNLIDTQ